ncbi:MAG: hypothetical protein RLZZ196_3489 [Bacteroidota bacterium]|jgi:hypothetical protein
MQTKFTNKLFQNKYLYKAVVICPGAHHFRSGDMDKTLEYLSSAKIGDSRSHHRTSFFKSQEDLNYAHKLRNLMAKFEGYDIRVESPWLSFYTNEKADIDKIVNLDSSKIKYISVPPKNTQLEKGTIILPKIPFDYRITLSATAQEYTAFLDWAEASDKVRLTKSTKTALQRSRSWGGTFFYIKGDNMLLLAKMHLGGVIARIDRIIKPNP